MMNKIRTDYGYYEVNIADHHNIQQYEDLIRIVNKIK